MGGFGTGLPVGQTIPALVTAQFDAQVTPAPETTHAGLPGQTSPELVSRQPGPAVVVGDAVLVVVDVVVLVGDAAVVIEVAAAVVLVV